MILPDCLTAEYEGMPFGDPTRLLPVNWELCENEGVKGGLSCCSEPYVSVRGAPCSPKVDVNSMLYRDGEEAPGELVLLSIVDVTGEMFE